MSTWFSSFFDNENEIARDVYNEYLDCLRLGLPSRKATQSVLDGFSEELADEEGDGVVVWMSLAVTQWKYGRLEPRVKAKALKILRAGGDQASYPPALQKRRGKVLERVRAQLESPPPAEKPVRVVKPVAPLKSIEKLWQPGQVVAFRRSSGKLVLLLTEVVERHRYAGEIPYFVVLKWRGAKLPAPEKVQKLRATDCVVGVMPNKKGAPVPWEKVERLDVTRELTGMVCAISGGVFCETGMTDGHWSELDSILGDELGD